MTADLFPGTETVSFRSVLNTLSPNPGAEMLRYGWQRPDILSLAQGEGSLQTPEIVCAAAAKAMAEGKTFYGPGLGLPEMRQDIASYYSRIYNLDIPGNRVFVTGSGTAAVHMALAATVEAGDEVIAITPIWKNLLGAIEMAQGTAVQVPLDDAGDRGWSLDVERLFAAITPRTKVILIVSPSNPTGWVMREGQMHDILDFARERGIWVIADEVYGRTVYEGVRAPSFLDVAEPQDRLFVVNSFSKAWAMTGWRLGWLVGPAAAEPVIRDISLYQTLCPPTVTQYAGMAALRHGEPFLAEQIALWRSNRDLLADRFAANGRIHMKKPEASFYAFFRVDGEPDCIAFARRLIDEVALSLAPGCAFGRCGTGWMRLCFAVSENRLVEALNRLESAIS